MYRYIWYSKYWHSDVLTTLLVISIADQPFQKVRKMLEVNRPASPASIGWAFNVACCHQQERCHIGWGHIDRLQRVLSCREAWELNVLLCHEANGCQHASKPSHVPQLKNLSAGKQKLDESWWILMNLVYYSCSLFVFFERNPLRATHNQFGPSEDWDTLVRASTRIPSTTSPWEQKMGLPWAQENTWYFFLENGSFHVSSPQLQGPTNLYNPDWSHQRCQRSPEDQTRSRPLRGHPSSAALARRAWICCWKHVAPPSWYGAQALISSFGNGQWGFHPFSAHQINPLKTELNVSASKKEARPFLGV